MALYNVPMAEVILDTGDYIATSGIYKLIGVLGVMQEYTLIVGDAAPKCAGMCT
jgi:hypothetical protein